MARPEGPQPVRLLFVCSMGLQRSPTAENIYENFSGFAAKSAGTDPGARRRVTEGLLGWADWIFVMETKHRDYLKSKFSEALNGKRLVCLRIPDDFAYNDPELIELLKMNLSPHVPAPE